jgi:hypothetical protein
MMMYRVVTWLIVIVALAATGCMRNECGDGNDQRREILPRTVQWASLAEFAAEDATDPDRKWWWCDVKGVTVPPPGWEVVSIGGVAGVGRWTRVDKWRIGRWARTEDEIRERWMVAALNLALHATNGEPRNIKCRTVQEVSEDHDRFLECKAPVERGPVTPGGGSDPLPLPPGSTGGDP